MKIGGEGEKN